MIPGTTIHTGTIIIPFTGQWVTHGDIILPGASASHGVPRIIIHHGIILTGMAAITTVTGIRPIVTHTDMVTMTPTTEVTMVIIITITTDPVRFITDTAEASPQEEERPPEILLMQGILRTLLMFRL